MIVIKLYSAYGFVDSETSANLYVYRNFSGLSNGWYYLNASCNDTAGGRSFTGTRVIYVNFSAAEWVSLNYTKPKVGCSENHGCSGSACPACQYPSFNTTKFQQYNVSPFGENMTMPFWNITNNGTVAINVIVKLNQTTYPGVKFKMSTTRLGGIEHVCSQTFAPSSGCMYVMDTNEHVLAENVYPGLSVQGWLYTDFVGVPGGTMVTRNITIYAVVYEA
jgi:hypothetical protein